MNPDIGVHPFLLLGAMTEHPVVLYSTDIGQILQKRIVKSGVWARSASRAGVSPSAEVLQSSR